MIQVVAAVIEREGRILIAQRRRHDPHPLKWEFPGGKVEPGETPVGALFRELREELGVEATPGAQMARYSYSYPERSPIELIFYQVALFEGEPENLVFEQLVWELPSRLVEYDFLDGDVEFIRTQWGKEVDAWTHKPDGLTPRNPL